MANTNEEHVTVEVDQKVYDDLACRAEANDMTIVEYIRFLVEHSRST